MYKLTKNIEYESMILRNQFQNDQRKILLYQLSKDITASIKTIYFVY